MQTTAEIQKIAARRSAADGHRKIVCQTGRELFQSSVTRPDWQPGEAGQAGNVVIPRGFLASPVPDHQLPELPEIKLNHLERMTDPTGIFRHAVYSVPNFSGGYCTDDNARAFILMVMLEEMDEEPEHIRTLATTYAAFLNHAFNPKTGRFRHYMGFDRHWLDEQGTEDSHGRVLWALGTAVGRSSHGCFKAFAGEIFAKALPVVAQFTSPRAWAFALLGINEYLRVLSGDEEVMKMRNTLTSRLLEQFIRSAHSNWHWFEDTLTFENARIAHALIASGTAPGLKTALDCGLHTLRWLSGVQISERGHFRPVGNQGFYPRTGTRAHFNQQPVEAHAMASACIEAYRATSNPVWYENAQRAFDWFLGGNDLGLALYSADTGGCRDELLFDRMDANQGAESTLAFLLSLAEMRLAQNIATVFNSPMA